MEISISKKSMILVSTLILLSLFIIMVRPVSTYNSIYHDNIISDLSLKVKISNLDTSTLLTTDI